MQSVEQWVLGQLQSWLERGDTCWLSTIVATVGASPRPLGSLLALNQAGEVAGSLSGGCVEDDLIERLQAGKLATSRPDVVTYGVTAEENERLGLPCGGRLQVLVEPVEASRHLPAIATILARLDARRCVRRTVSLHDGSWQVEQREVAATLVLSDDSVRQDFGPRYQILLVGANELGRCIAELALAMDYRVLVCDPRENMREQWSVEHAEIVAGMPDDVVRAHASDAHSIVLTLTHDPRIDDMALMEALTGDAFYVGALGSQRTSDKRRERLLELALSEAEIARLHAPVGLPIGSKSAMEIAVAVMAELTQLRAQARLAER